MMMTFTSNCENRDIEICDLNINKFNFSEEKDSIGREKSHTKKILKIREHVPPSPSFN